MPLEATWAGLVDDAAIFPPGNVPLSDAAARHVGRRHQSYADLVGPLVVRDTDLPLLRGTAAALSVVVTGGAGQVPAPARLARKLGLTLAALEIPLQDLDDLAGNARRIVAAVDAAHADGVLDPEVPVYVELPATGPSAGWLAAADEVAGAELRLKFRTGGLEADAHPGAEVLASWIDAALDRETPFKCTAGLHHAVRHTTEEDFEQHGFLNVLVATRLLFDGAAIDEAIVVLEERDGRVLTDRARELDLVGARRWFRSFGSCSISEPLDDLVHLGLLPLEVS